MPVRKATALSRLLVKCVGGIRCLRIGAPKAGRKQFTEKGNRKGEELGTALHLGYRAWAFIVGCRRLSCYKQAKGK